MTEERELVALGLAVRLSREERGINAGELAAAAGIDPGRLEEIEAGRCAPAYDVLLALAGGLGVEPGAFVRRAARPRGLDPATASVVFGRRLRELRAKHGLPQDALADRTGLHSTAISRMERGLREPRVSTVLRLADGLDVQPGDLVNGLGAEAETASHGERTG